MGRRSGSARAASAATAAMGLREWPRDGQSRGSCVCVRVPDCLPRPDARARPPGTRDWARRRRSRECERERQNNTLTHCELRCFDADTPAHTQPPAPPARTHAPRPTMSGDSADRKGTKRKLEDSLDAVANEANSAENVSAQVRKKGGGRWGRAGATRAPPTRRRAPRAEREGVCALTHGCARSARVRAGGWTRARPFLRAGGKRERRPPESKMPTPPPPARCTDARPPPPPPQTSRLASIIAGLTKDGPASTDRTALRRATHALAELAKTGEGERGEGERARGRGKQ